MLLWTKTQTLNYGHLKQLKPDIQNKPISPRFLIVVASTSLFINDDKHDSSNFKEKIKDDKIESEIFIASIPPVADVYIDDEYIGKTNVASVNVKTGEDIM